MASVPPIFRRDHLRPADDSDAAFLARQHHPEKDPRAWHKRIALGGWFVADDYGEIVGYMHLEVDGAEGHFRQFVVLDTDRSVGDALVRKAISHFRRLGCTSAEVTWSLMNPDTYPITMRDYERADGSFWTRRGFERDGELQLDEEGHPDTWVEYRFVRPIEGRRRPSARR